MQKRRLGKSTLEVSVLGLGCMNFVYAYGLPVEKKVALSVLRSMDGQGVTFFATATVYGPFTSEEVVGAAVAPFRDQVVRTTKLGFDLAPDGSRCGLNSRPEHIKKATEGSLTRLRTDRIALFYPHRVDPNVPIKDVAGTVQDLIKGGTVRCFRRSEAGPRTIRRAPIVQLVTAVQHEDLLWTRDPQARPALSLKKLQIDVRETWRNQRAHGSLWRSFAASIRRRRGIPWIEQERGGMELGSTPRRSARE